MIAQIFGGLLLGKIMEKLSFPIFQKTFFSPEKSPSSYQVALRLKVTHE